LVLAGLIVACAGLKQVSSIVGPVFLVLTLVVTVQPLNAWLIRRGLPRALATIASMLMVYALLIIVLGSVVWSLTRLATTLPDYSDRFTQLYQQALGWLNSLGVSTRMLQEAASSIDLGSFAGVARSALSGLSSGLSLLALVAALVVFLVVDSAGFGQRIALIHAERPRIADGLVDFAKSTRKYWIVTTIFGLIVAVLDVGALLIIGVPLAVTWGVLAFVTNYIPNIGFLLGLLPPTLIALLDGGVGRALAVLIVYTAINIVVQVLLQPRMTGDAVGITGTVAFLSLIFWSLILGPLGALLAVPATILVKSLLVDHSASSQWFGALINASPAKASKQKPLPLRTHAATGSTAVATPRPPRRKSR
jgi:predicted PurR-regulated permease PerM